ADEKKTAERASDLWSDIKTWTGFEVGKWALGKAISGMMQKDKDRFTSHLFNVFVSMPYVVVYIFERAKNNLAAAGEIDRTTYVNRLARMPRDLSDEYRLQIVLGARDA